MLRAAAKRACIGEVRRSQVGMAAVIDDIRKTGDSCGGEVTCIVRRCPKGLGSPVFGKLEAELAGAVMSLPASKVGLSAFCGCP